MGLTHKQNQRAIDAIVAIARAYARLPGFDFTMAKELAVRVDRALGDARTMEVIFALTVTLLRGLKVPDATDESLYG